MLSRVSSSRVHLVQCLVLIVLPALIGCGAETSPDPTAENPQDSNAVEWGHASSGEHDNTPADSTKDGRPPRTIVLMIADDQHYRDFGFGGNPAAVTPHLDRLARDGALFPVAHVGMSRCRPSLACLLTGIYPHQSGVYYNFANRDLDAGFDTLPRQLRRAGFECWMGGKYWEGDPRRMGFSTRGEGSDQLVREGQAQLEEFLDGARHEDVFLWWAPMLPHVPHNPDDQLLNRIDVGAIEQPPYVSDEDWPAWRENKRTMLAMGLWLDEGVGDLLEILDDQRRLENALIVFLVDNGFEDGAPAKGTAYERGFRTPVILWEPNRINPGTSLDQLISSLDLLPTILHWAGAELPESFQGRSLWPLLESNAIPWRDRLFGASYPRHASSPDQPKAEDDVQALYVRTLRWKYIVNIRAFGADESRHWAPSFEGDAGRGEAGAESLFDLTGDPEELVDLSGDPARHPELKEFREAVFRWWKETGGGPLPLGPEDLPQLN